MPSFFILPHSTVATTRTIVIPSEALARRRREESAFPVALWVIQPTYKAPQNSTRHQTRAVGAAQFSPARKGWVVMPNHDEPRRGGTVNRARSTSFKNPANLNPPDTS